MKLLNKINKGNLIFHNSSTLLNRPPPRIDPFTYRKLLSNCFKFGRTKDAAKLFDKIPDRDVVTYSIMIHGYAKNGSFLKSFELFSQMRVSGFVPNSFTFVGVLVGMQDLRLGQCVHGLVVKSGFESNLIVGTAMLDAYAKLGAVFDSHKLFEGLENPSLVSCNAVISGFAYNELFEETVLLFNRFRRSGLVPNCVMVLSVIQTCVDVGLRTLSESVHGLVVKFGLCFNLSVCNSFLDMYASWMDLEAATKLFDEMECRDVISWTTMIGLLVRLGCSFDALNLYRKMRDSCVDHDAVVLLNLVMACASLGDFKGGREIHAQIVLCGFGLELPLTNSLVSMYAKCGDFDYSRTMFDQIGRKSLVSWTAMITGYLQNGCPREALSLMNQVRSERTLCFDSVILVNTLAASGELALLELCQQLHCHIVEAGFIQYRSVQNTLISAYAKCGNVEHAYKIFNEMGNLRDVVSWNAIINGYGINGHGERAATLYQEMRNTGENPDSATYLSILSACSHSGLVDEGLVIINQIIEENKIKPNQEHLGCIVDLLSRASCLWDANGLASKALEGMGANACRALLSACALHGNVELAELAARRASELDPKDPRQMVLLSNVYASVGRFQDAEVLRWGSNNHKWFKNPGISWLS